MSSKKINKEELENLQQFIANINMLSTQRSDMCFEKELAMKKIQADFDKNWMLVNLNIQQSVKNQKEFMGKLNEKYGKDKSFDIQTGEIKKQRKD